MRLAPRRLAFVLLLAGSLLLAAPGAALAGEGCGDGFDVVSHLFETSDTDASGTLSPEEFERAGLARYGMAFEAWDADGDGEASFDEYRDLYDRHHSSGGLGEGEIES